MQKRRGPRQERLAKKKLNESKSKGLSYRDLEFKYNNLLKHQNSLKVDLVEIENWYVVHIEMPGFYEKDIKVQLKENQILLIQGIKSENNDKLSLKNNTDAFDSWKSFDSVNTKVIYRECNYGNIIRRVKLQEKVLWKSIQKKYINGILFIYIQKKVPEVTEITEVQQEVVKDQMEQVQDIQEVQQKEVVEKIIVQIQDQIEQIKVQDQKKVPQVQEVKQKEVENQDQKEEEIVTSDNFKSKKDILKKSWADDDWNNN